MKGPVVLSEGVAGDEPDRRGGGRRARHRRTPGRPAAPSRCRSWPPRYWQCARRNFNGAIRRAAGTVYRRPLSDLVLGSFDAGIRMHAMLQRHDRRADRQRPAPGAGRLAIIWRVAAFRPRRTICLLHRCLRYLSRRRQSWNRRYFGTGDDERALDVSGSLILNRLIKDAALAGWVSQLSGHGIAGAGAGAALIGSAAGLRQRASGFFIYFPAGENICRSKLRAFIDFMRERRERQHRSGPPAGASASPAHG